MKSEIKGSEKTLHPKGSPDRRSVTIVAAGTQDDVRAMYEAYPYPSPLVGESLIDDVANNLGFLYPQQTLDGKRILDAGCGSGHRLLGAAKRYPKAAFWGVDITSASLGTAKRLAEKHAIHNVHFEQADLLDLHIIERFDIIVSTGVIHHLEDPARGLANVSSLLSDDGVFIVWLYHSLGEHRRLCDRELFLTLWGGVKSDREEGLQLLRDLGMKLDTKQYGSTAAQKARHEVSQVHIEVDAYMHPIVNAYRFEEAIKMFSACNVDWTAISGVNLVDSSKLIDLSEVDKSDFSFFNVQVDELFKDESLRRRYRKLDGLSKLRVIELKLSPTGFTILGGRGMPSKLCPRIEGNVVLV